MEQYYNVQGYQMLSNCQEEIKSYQILLEENQKAFQKNDQAFNKILQEQAIVQGQLNQSEKQLEGFMKEMLEVNQIQQSSEDQIEQYLLQPHIIQNFQDELSYRIQEIQNKQQVLLKNKHQNYEELQKSEIMYDTILQIISDLEREQLEYKVQLAELQVQYNKKFKGNLDQIIFSDDQQNEIQTQIVQQLMDKLGEFSAQLKQISFNQIKLENKFQILLRTHGNYNYELFMNDDQKLQLKSLQQNQNKIQKEIDKLLKELEEVQSQIKEITKEYQEEEKKTKNVKENKSYFELCMKFHGQNDTELQQKLDHALEEQLQDQKRIKDVLIINERDKANKESEIEKKKQELSYVLEQINKMIIQSSNIEVNEIQNKQQIENNIDQEQQQFQQNIKDINLKIKLNKAKINLSQFELSKQSINVQNKQKQKIIDDKNTDLEQNSLAMKILQEQLKLFHNYSIQYYDLKKQEQELMNQLDNLKLSDSTLKKNFKHYQEELNQLQQRYEQIIQQLRQ